MEKIIITHNDKKDKKVKGNFKPTGILALGFIVLILLGTILLSLPYATVDGQGTSLLDAFFTATSAVCVTGLVVVDTGTYYTLFGQIVILVLIQIGGLGFMTFATLIAIIMGRKITLKERMLLQEALNQRSLEGIVRLTKYVIQIAFLIEALGALILSLHWAGQLGWSKAIYYGIFHSISAFNNAGFDLFGDFTSMSAFTGDPITNLVMMTLIVLGGLGFLVLSELYLNRFNLKLHLHSHLVLKISAFLIVIGTIIIFILEFSNPETLGTLNPVSKFFAALFQSVTARTAGFNTIDIASLRDTTQLFIIFLMFIGASPGSTGGGIKTTTFVIVVLSIIAILRGKWEVSIRERTIPKDLASKAMAISVLALLLVLTTTTILTLTETADFMTLLFEATSAFGTVGLSLGITPYLSTMGKIAIIITMYAGRVGPLTLAFALAQKRKAQVAQFKYPEERILIG